MNIVKALQGKFNPPKSAIRGLEGSFIKGLDGYWHVVYQVPLRRMFDWLEDTDVAATHAMHRELLLALFGHRATVEVLPLALSIDERVAMIREQERPSRSQMRDTAWQAARQSEALKIARSLASRPGGDWEVYGFLIVSLQPNPEVSMTEMEFAVRSDAGRYYLEHFEHASLIEPAEVLRIKLASIWPGIEPASRKLVDKLLMATIWPGQMDLDPPIREQGVVEQDEFMLEYYGRADYRDSRPYEVEVDYYGSKSYVTCLPLRLPTFKKYVPNQKMEFGFQSYEGRRVRFTWTFQVVGGKEAITAAGNDLDDVTNHAKSHALAGGHAEDIRRNVEVAKHFYTHLQERDGHVLRGRPMLIVAARTSEELVKFRATIRASVRKSGAFAIEDNQVQRRLLVASIPGAKPFNRHIRTVGPKLAANAMPFVTSGPPMSGPHLFGFTMGNEIRPVFNSLAGPLRRGQSVAPVYCFHGPSRRGKTTALVDWLLPLSMEGFVTHIFDLAKFDLGLLDATKLPRGVRVNMANLVEHPGCLNPVLLSPPEADPVARDELRVSAMVAHLRKCCGRKWHDEWMRALQGACVYVLRASYARNPDRPQEEVIPSLYEVVTRLYSGDGGFAHEGELAAVLTEALSDRRAADISCSNASVRSFIDQLSQPGFHVIQQTGLVLPEGDLDIADYEPRHDLAMASLDLAALLSYTIAMSRDVPVAIGHVEFNRTSRLSKGKNAADFLARVGGAMTTITLYDTQLATDLAPTLREQVTGWAGFTPNSENAAKLSIEYMGLVATPTRVANFMGLTDPGWSSDSNQDGVTKGGIFFRPPAARPVLMAVMCARWYIGTSFITDRSERDDMAIDTLPATSEPALAAATHA